ncbi:MAG: RNA-binding protein [Ignavibacteriae bacterium HGW-Ignavibacteriae-2]|jgi:RNA recognition motif-containing protein|nr:RNA-binding protein [Bacteroidota bacterium]PKL88853.1 MAG: RNA-binding protein [Ignavibacteriae bacterium HGW-Ignavibacteriae-2]
MKIYVGNLSYEASVEDLRTAFEAYGKVDSAEIIKDKFSGRSKGFAFIEMPDKDEAEAAIKGLNGLDMKGRNIVANEARPKAEGRPSRGGYGSGSRGGSGGRSDFGGNRGKFGNPKGGYGGTKPGHRGDR